MEAFRPRSEVLPEPPGIVTRNDDELLEAFRSGAVWGEAATRLRAAFRQKFCALEDGRAAERVVRRVWLADEHAAERAGTDELEDVTKVEA